MDAENVEDMTKEKAKEEYVAYSRLVKERHEEHLEILKRCTYHLSQGKKLLNVYDVLKKGGVFENGEPKLAIGNADWGTVVFSKHRGKTGIYGDRAIATSWNRNKEQIQLPINHFKEEWEITETAKKDNWFTPVRTSVRTPIPIIPGVLMPNGKLNNYYILFEVKEWAEQVGSPGTDPILLKRLSPNMFVVLATWDVSPLEKAVLEGLG